MSRKSFDKQAARLLQELAEEQTGREQSYVVCLNVVRAAVSTRGEDETRENFVLRVFHARDTWVR